METFWKNGQEAPSEKNQKRAEQLKEKIVFVLELFFLTFM